MADVPLNEEEQFKLQLITEVTDKKIKPEQAAKMLGISVRQIRRLRQGVKERGRGAVQHGLKGKSGNHQIDTAIKAKTLQLIAEKYSDFKPTFATEKLEENHAIEISRETTRLWMIESKLWKSLKQKGSDYHSWRPRKEHFGELEQFDGSYHFWFEKRYIDANGDPIEVCLLASIDDATGKITKAKFLANEGVVAVFTFWREYVQEIGKPLGIYLDKFSTYKINHKSAVDNTELLTQFQRAMRQLKIELIPANSAQAKGRVERLFGTLQDRLVKELRLAEINTPDEGNKFLTEVFIPKFNAKFSVLPAQEGDVHKQLFPQEKERINHIFSVHHIRVVNNDFTLQFKNHWYQLAEIQPITVRAKDRVLVEEWIDGTIHFSFRNKYLTYTRLPEKPKKVKENPLIITSHKLNWKPPEDHPWRKGFQLRS